MDFWSPYPYLQICTSDPINPAELDPQHVEKVIRALTNAFRTLSFRGAIVYSILRELGARDRLPLLSRDDLLPLSAEQEAALFQEMERRGAFTERDFVRQYTALNNRERWRVHREEDGEVWNPDMRLGSPG